MKRWGIAHLIGDHGGNLAAAVCDAFAFRRGGPPEGRRAAITLPEAAPETADA